MLRESVTEDWRSPVADTVAAAWGFLPGRALFWRSSAAHVFVVLDATGDRREAYLRFVPARLFERGDVEDVAALMARLAGVGMSVGTIPSLAGDRVETVGTAYGLVHATVVPPADGTEIDVDELTPDRAQAWGAALGRVHRDGTTATRDFRLPDGRDRFIQALDLLEDGPCGDTARLLRPRLLALPQEEYGLIHGDYELDNVAWRDDVLVAFDWDEAERSWFAADVAHAVRDLWPQPEVLVSGSLPLLDAFLDGYHRERPAAGIDRATLALFTALNCLRSAARLVPVLAEDPSVGSGLKKGGGIDAGRPLREALEAYVRRQQDVVERLAVTLT